MNRFENAIEITKLLLSKGTEQSAIEILLFHDGFTKRQASLIVRWAVKYNEKIQITL